MSKQKSITNTCYRNGDFRETVIHEWIDQPLIDDKKTEAGWNEILENGSLVIYHQHREL